MEPPKKRGGARGLLAVSRGLAVLETGFAALACVALAVIMLIAGIVTIIFHYFRQPVVLG